MSADNGVRGWHDTVRRDSTGTDDMNPRGGSALWAGLLFEWLFGVSCESMVRRALVRECHARYAELRVGDVRCRVLVGTTVDEDAVAWAQRLERARRLSQWALRGDCALIPDLRTAQPPMMGDEGVMVAQGPYGVVALDRVSLPAPVWRFAAGQRVHAHVRLAAPPHEGVVSIVPTGESGSGWDVLVESRDVQTPSVRAQLVARDGAVYLAPHASLVPHRDTGFAPSGRVGTVTLRVRGCQWVARGTASSPAWVLAVESPWAGMTGDTGHWVSDGRRLALFFDALGAVEAP